MSTNSLTRSSLPGHATDRDEADTRRFFDLLTMSTTAILYGDDAAADRLTDKARRLAHRCASRGNLAPILELLSRALGMEE